MVQMCFDPGRSTLSVYPSFNPRMANLCVGRKNFNKGVTSYQLILKLSTNLDSEKPSKEPVV